LQIFVDYFTDKNLKTPHTPGESRLGFGLGLYMRCFTGVLTIIRQGYAKIMLSGKQVDINPTSR